MPQENVEIVRRAIEAFNREDFDVALEDAAPDATLDVVPLAVGTGVVVIVVAIAVVLLALILAASTRGRQRRKAQRRTHRDD